MGADFYNCLLSPLYKVEIETIYSKGFIASVSLKLLYLKCIYKLEESFLFLSTRFLDYRKYIVFNFHTKICSIIILPIKTYKNLYCFITPP